MRFKILHTNDIHSNYENFAKIKTLIDEIKDDNTLILDAGDFADFKRIELIGTRGKLAGELLSEASYDAITVGNNETFQGIQMLEEMASNSQIPYLSCNMYKEIDTELNGVFSHIIIKKQGIRFLIIGTSPVMAVFPELMGFSYKNYKHVIKTIINENKDRFDISILLNHIGTSNDVKLAFSDIDFIISGHDHQLYERAKIINNTINNSAGNFGEYLGMIEFDYSNKKITLIDSKTISTNNIKEDEEIINILNKNKIIATLNLSKPLFQIEKTLWHDFIDECPLGNFLADALKDIFKTDIGLINIGIVSGGIKKGDVTEKKLIDICPSPLNPTYFEIQGKYLKDALQKSLQTEVCLNNGRGPGFRGICVGRLHVSGLKITYDKEKIISIYVNDELLDDEKWYTVASSDYLQRGTVYSSLANNKNPKYKVEYVRDTLREYLVKKDFIDNSFNERWIKI